MKIVTKSTDVFEIKAVKTGTDKKERNWYMAKVENPDGHLNLFCSDFNFEKIANLVGKRVYLILEYTETYSFKNQRSYTSYILKDVEIA